jgi:hypothetical protein
MNEVEKRDCKVKQSAQAEKEFLCVLMFFIRTSLSSMIEATVGQLR